ncbi:hypothetical protein EV140_2358 [Microcella alkaliphila]|uniref:DNA polymerase III subunit gamma/tau n=1 Tax=Microcella alkaliphila TaxID=279828 RepID=A0A4Q7TFB9_9MICO|nr:hypothetical protein [Microcella alkaliphila]RZT58118.1 hypothetical protein EV140_2358 [Microcella alkaliphila]
MARPDDPDDDAALRWDDVDDASYDLGPAPGEEPETAAADAAAETGEAGRAAGERGRSALLVATSVFGGIYIMYVVGWLIGGLRLSQSIFQSLSDSGAGVLELNAYRFAEFLAIIATPLWFIAVVVLTAGSATRRLGWLAIGLLILAPWPFLIGLISTGGAS